MSVPVKIDCLYSTVMLWVIYSSNKNINYNAICVILKYINNTVNYTYYNLKL